MWNGFYRKSLFERKAQIELVYPHLKCPPDACLGPEVADTMVENCIGTVSLPLGLCLNMKLNNKNYTIPMAVEEPSVIAAASGGCKTICATPDSPGFIGAHTTNNIMIAQLLLVDVDCDLAEIKILESKKQLILYANQFCKSMVKRGGGVVDIEIRKIKHRAKDSKKPNFLVVHLLVDVCEAMGANIVTTIAEGVSPFVRQLTGGRVSCRILSNLAVRRLASSSFRVPCSSLNYKGVDGFDLANRIVDLYDWADSDPYRAATHNKGIMNGIDSVALATGQDWRAIEACAHAYATHKNGYYGSLTEYWIEHDEEGAFFCGKLEMPLPVGVKGGPLATNPMYSYSLGLLGFPTSQELTMIMLSVGLAQNFSALRSLATEGIQRGHMGLHARNIATAAGSPAHAVSEVANYIVARKSICVDTALEYLQAHDLLSQLHRSLSVPLPNTPPSMMSYRSSHGDDESSIDSEASWNAAFATLGEDPIYLEFGELPNENEENSEKIGKIQKKLFGDKNKKWLSSIFAAMNCFRLHQGGPPRETAPLQKRLKSLSVIINLLTCRLHHFYPKETRSFIAQHLPGRQNFRRTSFNVEEFNLLIEAEKKNLSPIFGAKNPDQGEQDKKNGDLLGIGLPLILALWQVFENQVNQWVAGPLKDALIEEQCVILCSLVSFLGKPNQGKEENAQKEENGDVGGTATTTTTTKNKNETEGKIENEKENDHEKNSFLHFMTVQGHVKRFQVSMFILCDALCLDPEQLTHSNIDFMLRVGSYFEWIGTVIHDISRFRRAIVEREPNSFVEWIRKERCLKTSSNDFEVTEKDYTPERIISFYQTACQLIEKDKREILQVQVPSQLMDTHKVFEDAIASLLKYYEVEVKI